VSIFDAAVFRPLLAAPGGKCPSAPNYATDPVIILTTPGALRAGGTPQAPIF